LLSAPNFPIKIDPAQSMVFVIYHL
jgi:hypothetical protein